MKVTKKFRQNIEGYAFISPWVLGFCLFIVGPMLYAFYVSLLKWDILSPPQFIGFANYIKAFHDYRFWTSLRITVVFVFASGISRVLMGLLLALILKQFMSRGLPGGVLFRTLWFLPIMFSGVALGILWTWLYEPEYGIINDLLGKLGIEGPNWLGNPHTVMPSIVIMMVWNVGGMMLIFLAGLLDIPSELYEAADIDGARSYAKFFNITLPMLTPTIFFNLIATLIQSFQIFGPVYVLTKGGPANLSLVYVINLYKEGFEYFHMGYACALAWMLFIIIFLFTYLLFRSQHKWVFYRGE